MATTAWGARGFNRTLMGVLYGFHAWCEKTVLRFSLVTDKQFFDTADFPWVGRFEERWQSIQAELGKVLERRNELLDYRDLTPSAHKISAPGDWHMFMLYAYGKHSELNCAQCPETTRILADIPGMNTAFFSILEPGTHIIPHRGLYTGILRCHLALKVPKQRESCWLRVGTETRSWEEGRCLIFNDAYEHEVLNGTDEVRVVLILDILRPLPFHIGLANRGMHWLMQWWVPMGEGIRKQREWEKKFYR
jgi:ornithine lipid ester-linked acyl 2-hydroxylase